MFRMEYVKTAGGIFSAADRKTVSRNPDCISRSFDFSVVVRYNEHHFYNKGGENNARI